MAGRAFGCIPRMQRPRGDTTPHNVRRNEYFQRLRTALFQFYGPWCNCCGETQREFLALDHVHNDGNLERKNRWNFETQPETSRSAGKRSRRNSQLIREILRGERPKENYQILCHNCNMAKSFYGACPHTKMSLVTLSRGA